MGHTDEVRCDYCHMMIIIHVPIIIALALCSGLILYVSWGEALKSVTVSREADGCLIVQARILHYERGTKQCMYFPQASLGAQVLHGTQTPGYQHSNEVTIPSQPQAIE